MIRARPGTRRRPWPMWQESNCSCGLPGADTAAALLDWYDRERRDLPWRARRGASPTPIASGCREIMLQQTTVKAVIPYYESFLARWPTVEALAAATLDDVLAAWAGLGYYSRARNLYKCAQIVAERARRALSRDRGRAARAAGHRALHGRGDCRHRLRRGDDAGRRQHRAGGGAALCGEDAVAGGQARDRSGSAATLTPASARRRFRAGPDGPRRQRVHAQASLVPDVSAAERVCRAWQGIEAELPARAARPERPGRVGLAFLALREDGARAAAATPGGRPARRHAGGALDGMGRDAAAGQRGAARARRCAASGGRCPASLPTPSRTSGWRRWSIAPSCRPTPRSPSGPIPRRCQWVARRDLDRAALPSVMRKIIAHGLREQ